MARGVSFANLICHFGENLVLLDLAREVVLPAFLDGTLRRRYGHTSYFFLNMAVARTAEEVNGVPLVYAYGRLVKDTVLVREQIYSLDLGLVPAVEEMASAPSSFFTLILNNHKLMYLPETADAPSLAVFQSTLQKFLSIKHREYINALFEMQRGREDPKTKKQLYLEVPHPHVEVLPLASQASIDDFLAAFAKITHLEFRILEPNDEFPMEDTFLQVLDMKRALNATSTKLTHDSPAGLDSDAAIEQIHAASATGNQKVNLAGTSIEGVKLRGNNDDFKLTIESEGLPEGDPERAAELVRLYGEQAERGIIRQDAAPDTSEKVRRLL